MIDYPETVIKAFKELSYAQRGDPEEAMLAIQYFHSGVLSFVVEHTGDLTHRMTNKIGTSLGFQRETVIDKCEKVLADLVRPLVGWISFEEEHERNIISNARHGNIPIDIYRKELKELLRNYAAAHASLRVYNQLQYTARQAAIELGRSDFKWAAIALRKVLRIAENEKLYDEEAGKYILDASGYPVLYPYKDAKQNPKSIKMPLKDVIKEHERLVKVLRRGKPAELKEELKYQSKELKEYKTK